MGYEIEKLWAEGKMSRGRAHLVEQYLYEEAHEP